MFISCSSSKEQENENVVLTDSQLVDSIRYFRHEAIQTDLISRHIIGLERKRAFSMQLEMLKMELADGAVKVGWKMGGTATLDSTKFDPVFGYILDKNLIAPDSVVAINSFPGGSVMVEAEVGFVLKNDLVNGVASKEELLANIDYLVGAVEFAKGVAISADTSVLNTNYTLAAGMGQAGTIIGPVKISPSEFNFENETVKCFINDELAAEGVSSNIFGNPLNALYELANLLPKHNQYLKAGDLVISGSMYKHPILKDTANVRLEFSTLGTITFKSK
jgi:2-oxo-hept-3-ene-1,7-dioate hydratase